MERLELYDARLLIAIQQLFKNKYLDKFFKIYTHLGDAGAIWIVLGLAFMSFKQTRRSGVLMIGALITTWLFSSYILKTSLKRVRPYEKHKEVRLLIKTQKDTSFPSGHAASSIACATVVMITAGGSIGILCLVLALLMAFSRIYVGVHYPLDVIVGSLLGFIIAALTCLIFYL
ncbi:phosphatase PAP2 family protein [Fastidiosipila sanguinis]|uniref:Phosphatase PAP2 family protein n=1 Tax=Fastidiosipila sanguinis TaxID=236753 RepID=A0A2S0KNZ8_9FIRM|nr:phosphatase PAP2 family protein [Fastidiosipila sanguinis]AVM42756.1 phosphatase PAP2 family protein [Fastidiosipila sanguinis]